MSDERQFRTPGQLILALLEERGWTQRVLAVVLGADETGINKIVSGGRQVTAELAISLEEVFGVPADRFLTLQKEYDLAKARIVAQPDPDRANRARLFAGLPIAEMAKRGWIDAPDPRDVPRVEAELSKFFGVATVRDIEILPHAAKKTMVNRETSPVQLAWLYRVKSIAEEMMVARYSERSLDRALVELRKLMIAPEESRSVTRILTESGVRFVIVESLPGAKIDGVCFWLDDHSPVVGLSLRYDRIDNFWFVLRHELEHVRLRHGHAAMILDAELEGERAGLGPNVSEEERLANAAAQDYCVPMAKMDQFIARKAPLFAERDLLGFAKLLGVHPGIVAGQLHHRTGRHDRFRQHLAAIRRSVVLGAAVDGWGDVYPLGA